MEIVGVTAAIVNVSVIIIELSKLVQKLTQIRDPRIRLVRSRLVTERRKFANWSVALNIRDIEDLKPNVQEDDFRMVVECVQDVEKFIEIASRKVSKLDLLETKGFKTITARFKWLYGEFDDLKLLVDTLTAMVDALYVIAPVPPLYDRLIGLPLGGVNATTHDQRPPVPEQESLASGGESITEDIERSKQASTTAILNLYEQCKQALQTIKVQIPESDKNPLLEKALSRLKLWGTDLFEGETTLDKLLESELNGDKEQNPIRAAVILVLVDIALIEDIMLGLLSLNCDDQERPRIQGMQLQVVAILGIPGVEDIATQRSLPDLDAGEEPGVLSRTTKRLLLAVDDLYELLPAIRGVRRESHLLMEEKGGKRSQSSLIEIPLAIPTQPSLLLSPPEDATVSEWVDWSVESTTYLELQLYHKMNDDVNASSTINQKYYALVKKHSEILKNWAESASASKLSETSVDQEKKIRHILMSYKESLPVTSVASPNGKDDIPLDEKSLMKFVESIETTNEKLRDLTTH